MAFPAFFDTCALYGGTLSDLFLRLAERGAFRPLWSEGVIAELRRNLTKNGLEDAAVDKRLTAMCAYYPDAMVEGYEHLIAGMQCQAKDRHILAAAVRSNSEVLVTFNLRDFPDSSVVPYEIEVVHPDAFLLDQLDLFPGIVMQVMLELADDYDAPPMTIDDLLRTLGRAGVPKFAQEIATRYL